MNASDFSYWLKGFFELREPDSSPLTERQIKIIQDHLELVFTKVTPERVVEEAPTESPIEKFLREFAEKQATPNPFQQYNPNYIPAQWPDPLRGRAYCGVL